MDLTRLRYESFVRSTVDSFFSPDLFKNMPNIDLLFMDAVFPVSLNEPLPSFPWLQYNTIQ